MVRTYNISFRPKTSFVFSFTLSLDLLEMNSFLNHWEKKKNNVFVFPALKRIFMLDNDF